MNSKHPNRLRRIVLIAVAAALINGALLYALFPKPLSKLARHKTTASALLRATPTAAPARLRLATFAFSPSELAVAAGKTFPLTITLSSRFPLVGADAVLSFNPAYLSVEKIGGAGFFSLYPRLTYDNSVGKIIITGIAAPNQQLPSPLPPSSSKAARYSATSSAAFAVLTLRARKPGTTTIAFDFARNSTTASTAVRAGDAKNVLTHIQNGTLKIKRGATQQ